MKLLIAIPSRETMRVEFVQSLMGLMRRLDQDGIAYEVNIQTGTLVYCVRDGLARHAVNNRFDQVLWVDSDMVFSPGIYDDLATGGYDIACGLFISRHSPFMSCLFSCLTPSERITDYPFEAFEVAGCGFGCVLMKTQVLADVMHSNNGMCFLPEPKLGEDLAFCRRAAGCGYRIFCEPTARVGHVGSMTIWPEDAERLLGNIQGLEGKKLN
jgi:hypothetical protein